MGIVCLDQGKIMQAYSRKLKLRLAWWITWWSICCLLALGYFIETIGILSSIVQNSYHEDMVYELGRFVGLTIFGIIAFTKIPSLTRLLKKDLKQDKDNIYAKAVLLEVELKKHKRQKEANEERNRLEEKVKSMQDELNEVNPPGPIQHPNKN